MRRDNHKVLTVAYSPCPNDTFMFHDLASGALRVPGFEVETRLHDVETLNRKAMKGVYDVTKLSFPAYLRVRNDYTLLGAGAAVGFGCGPIVVAARPRAVAELGRSRIAVPGELTTAWLLFRLWAPQAGRPVFTTYDKVMGMVADGRVDAGILIHEGRFVYRKAGLVKLVDLGQWWEKSTGLPIPLGGIAMRKSLGEPAIRCFERTLRRAIRHSLSAPRGTMDYVRRHAQELDQRTINRHIRMFVNEFSVNLGAAGRAAIRKIEALAGGTEGAP